MILRGLSAVRRIENELYAGISVVKNLSIQNYLVERVKMFWCRQPAGKIVNRIEGIMKKKKKQKTVRVLILHESPKNPTPAQKPQAKRPYRGRPKDKESEDAFEKLRRDGYM